MVRDSLVSLFMSYHNTCLTGYTAWWLRCPLWSRIDLSANLGSALITYVPWANNLSELQLSRV